MPRRKLTDMQAEEIRNRHHEGEKIRSLSDWYEVDYFAIRQILIGGTYKLAGGKIGLCADAMATKLSDDDVIAIRNLIRGGTPTFDVADKFGVQTQRIREVAIGLGFSHLNDICPPVTLTGEHSDRKMKIKRVDRQEIRDYFNGDNPTKTMTEVAKEYGVSLSRISRIVSGKR